MSDTDVNIAAVLVSTLGLGVVAALACWAVAGLAEAAGAAPLVAGQIGALWAVTPGPVLFGPGLDPVHSALIVLSAWCALRALKSAADGRAVLWSAACGTAAAAALFVSFGAAAMLAAAGSIVLAGAIAGHVARDRVGLVAVSAAAVFAAWMAAPVVYGYRPLDVMMTGLNLHRERWTLPRSREIWWRYNLLDFGMFMGWPLIATVLLRAPEIRRSTVAARAMLVTGVCALLLLDAADVTRGEVGRLWMPLVPLLFPLALAAITPAERDEPRRVQQHAALTVLAALQAALCIAIRLSWDV